MAYNKEHFKYIDMSKKILKEDSVDSWEATLCSSQDETFDYVLASDVIEYVPDVLKFFADVQKKLTENGKLYLTISNKAFSADCYRQPTTFAEIYDIHKRGVQNNPVRALDYLLNVKQNNVLPYNTEAFDLGLQIYERLQKSDEQAGVSLNVFTPESFLLIIYSMLKLRMLPFKVLFFSAPPESPDFDVVLEKSESVLETEMANTEAENVQKALKEHEATSQFSFHQEDIAKIFKALESPFLKSQKYYNINVQLFYTALNNIGILNYRNEEESGEYDFLKKYLGNKTSPIVFDVGANRGDYSIMVNKINPTAKLSSFEPDKTAFSKLKNNIGSGEQIKIYNYGMSDNCGTKEFFNRADELGSGHSSLYKEVITDIHHIDFISSTYEFSTIDTFVKQNNIEKIDLLKIDTEGHEFAVLIGANDSIEKGLISAIHFEFNEMNVISRVFFRDFANFLKDFDLYRMLPDGLVRLESYPPVIAELFAFQNIVAIRKISHTQAI